MRFKDKLRLRDKIMMGFAKAGETTSREILMADFCEFERDCPPSITANFNERVLIRVYKVSKSTEHGKKDGFFSHLKPDRIFVNSRRMSDHAYASSVMRHEHIHFLQYALGMDEELFDLDVRDVDRRFKNPPTPKTLGIIDYSLYLTSESELMPRLHQIVSTFAAMGGKIPENAEEFEALLWFCEIGTDQKSEYDEMNLRDLCRYILPRISDAEAKETYQLFFQSCSGDLYDIQAGIDFLKQEIKFKAKFLLVSAYVRLLNIYGYDINMAEFTGMQELPQLTIERGVPILSAT